jgi:hypothetical protein
MTETKTVEAEQGFALPQDSGGGGGGGAADWEVERSDTCPGEA